MNKLLLPILLLLPLLLLLGPSGNAQEKWDLRRCVEYSLANNISIKQADIQARLSKLTYDQSKLLQIPTLIAGIGTGVNSGRSQNPSNYTLSTITYTYNNYSLQSSVNLFNFFGIKNTIAGSRKTWEAYRVNVDKIKNDISLNVANGYLQVLLAAEQMEASRLQLKLSQNSLEITRKQVAAGTLPELNAAELESQVAQDSATVISTAGTVTQNILNLKAVMGMDAGTPFDVSTPPADQIPIDSLSDLQPELVYNLAIYNQPLQKMDSLQVEAYKNQVKTYRAMMYPTFTLSGGLGSNYTSIAQQPVMSSLYPVVDTIGRVAGTTDKVVVDGAAYGAYRKTPYFDQLNQNFSQFIGLNVSVPIFNQGSAKVAYAKSKLNLRNQELVRDQDNLILKQNIYLAYTAALTAQQKFQANKITVANSAKSYEYAKKRYDIGMLNTIDLLTNQNNKFKAEIDLIYSQFDYVFKMKVLEFYKGMGIRLSK